MNAKTVGQSDNPTTLMRFAQQYGSERKLRLYLCATATAFRSFLKDDGIWNTVEVAERYADGVASFAELDAAHKRACQMAQLQTGLPDMDASQVDASQAAWWVALTACPTITDDWTATRSSTLIKPEVQCTFLWEIFLPIFVKLAGQVAEPFPWISGNVSEMASVIYNERQFHLMPILADALQDTGCHEAVILNHCRSGCTHVRGCWVVDMILGKQ